MENLRYLLAAIAALTLIMSVVSSVNPSYFVGLNAYADDEDEEDDDSSGSGSNDDGDDDDKNKSSRNNDKERENDDDELVQSLGNHSEVTLKIDDDVELEVEIEDGDLGDGTYDVMFACDTPDIDEEFAGALEVEDGEGEFETELSLSNGTYAGCEVDAGGLSAAFQSFSIMAREDDDDEEEDEEERDDEGEDEKEREHDRKEKSRLKTDDDGVEIEFEAEGIDMADGLYDAVFACDQPAFNMTLDDAFEVEDGEGELETEFSLANGTYSGCELAVRGTVLASFDRFTVEEDDDDDDDDGDREEKRKERKERIVTTTSGREIHDRHRGERAASPGEYQPGWNYTLMANGTAMQSVRNGTADEADVELDVDMAVWKSNRAVILLDVIDGTVHVGNQTYTVVLGYALYTIHHDTFRIGALVVDGDGNVFRLKLSGSAEDGAEFPMESGSIDLAFEGRRGPPDRLGDWALAMDGKVTAG